MATLEGHVSLLTYALHHRDCPPRVRRHGCRRTVRRRSQGRKPAWVPIRDDPEFRLKRDVALAPKANAGRASPVARRRRSVDVRRSGGRLANKKIHSLNAHRKCKLGSAPPPYIKSEVPPAVHGSEVAIAAPFEVHAPMEPWPMDVANHRQDGCFECELTKAKNDVPQ